MGVRNERMTALDAALLHIARLEAKLSRIEALVAGWHKDASLGHLHYDDGVPLSHDEREMRDQCAAELEAALKAVEED